MGYNWRQAVWYPAEKMIYGVHGNSGYLFRFDPRAARVEVLDRITSEPSQRSGMYDKFRYGYLGFTLGPDQRTLYYLTGGPIPAGEKPPAAQASGPAENLHLVTYDIPTARCVDHGPIFFADGQRPAGVHSIAVGQDGTVYALSRVNRNGRIARDLIRIAPLSDSIESSQARTTIVVCAGRFPTAQAAAGAEAQIDWLDADRADDTACTQCFAALELQRYLRRMTGRSRDFPVVDDEQRRRGRRDRDRPAGALPLPRALVEALGVGDGRLAALGPEGYRIRSSDGRRAGALTLVAGRSGWARSTAPTICSIGWAAAGSRPASSTRKCRGSSGLADLDVTERPSFITRGFLAWEDRGDPDFLLWMARNRLNYWCAWQEQHALDAQAGDPDGLRPARRRGGVPQPGRAVSLRHPRLPGASAEA